MLEKASLILDLLLLAFCVAVVLNSRRKGLLTCIVELFGKLISLAAGLFTATHYGPVLYDKVIFPILKERLKEASADTIGNLITSLPGFLQGMVPGNVGSVAVDGLEATINAVIKPIILPFIQLLFFLAAYLVFRIATIFLARLLENTNRLPVIGGANKLLGTVLGIVLAGIDLFVALCVLRALGAVAGEGFNAMLGGSFIYTLFLQMDVFAIRQGIQDVWQQAFGK